MPAYFFFGQCAGAPILHRRQGTHGVYPSTRSRRQFDRIGHETPDDRSEHGVGNREAAEQEGTGLGMAAATAFPDFDDAINVGLHFGRTILVRLRRVNIHRHAATQSAEAGVHFGADRTCLSTRLAVSRPQGRRLFGQILANRQGIPDQSCAVDQARHLA